LNPGSGWDAFVFSALPITEFAEQE